MTNEEAKLLAAGDKVGFSGETVLTRHVLKTMTDKNGNVKLLIQGYSQNGYKDQWYPASEIE